MLLRVAADGTISRMVVSGRVLFGERVRDALLRHLEKDLGPMALPRLPPEPTPFTIVEYFPDPDRSAASTTPATTPSAWPTSCPSTATASRRRRRSTWRGSRRAEAVSPAVREQMTGGHDRLIRLALAHCGELP